MNKKNNAREAFQEIPSVDDILSNVKDKKGIPNHLLKTKVKEFLDKLRKEIKNQKIPNDRGRNYSHQ